MDEVSKRMDELFYQLEEMRKRMLDISSLVQVIIRFRTTVAEMRATDGRCCGSKERAQGGGKAAARPVAIERLQNGWLISRKESSTTKIVPSRLRSFSYGLSIIAYQTQA
jgi:hypothetical protein